MNAISAFLQRFFPEVAPADFYRTIFPLGELENAHEFREDYEPGRYTGIVIEKTEQKRKHVLPDGRKIDKELIKRYTVTDDLDVLDELCGRSPYFCFMSPISYAGKNRTMRNARFMYALAVEIDWLLHGEKPEEQGGLMNLLSMFDGGLYHDTPSVKTLPRPTFVVSSGNGVHLYYVFDHPLPMFQNVANSLKSYKEMLTKKLWNRHVTEHYQKEQIEFEPIWQGFRVVGTLTKRGIEIYKKTGVWEDDEVCRAYQTGDIVTVDYMNQWAQNKKQTIINQYRSRSGYNLAQAKEKWPDWYANLGKKPKGRWPVNRSVYEDWKKRLWTEVETGGKRYYCMMTLVIYAVKCGYYDPKKNPNPVTYEELEKDCYALMEKFESLHYVRKDGTYDPFTEFDVMEALQAYQASFYTFPKTSIEHFSGLEIIDNPRNGKPQKYHLEEARAIRDVRQNRKGKKWDDENGRKSKESIVIEWKNSHPNGTKHQCIKDTGLSKPTVYKWWDKEKSVKAKSEADNKRRLTTYQAKMAELQEAMEALQSEIDEMTQNINR